MRINVNLGNFAVPGHAFWPDQDSLKIYGKKAKAQEYKREFASPEKLLSALIILGLTSRDEKETFTVGEVVKVVRLVREDQGVPADAAVLSQRGIWRHKKDGRTVEEDGARIVILNVVGETEKEFLQNIEDLAAETVRSFHQERVIVEIQRGGVVESTYEERAANVPIEED